MSAPASKASPSDNPGPISVTRPLRARARSWLEDPSLSMKDRLAQAPSDGLVKGWLFQSVVENAKRHGVELDAERRYLGFKDYPVAEYLELLAQGAVRVNPEQPARETLRELGRGVYSSFARSLFGKVILAGLGSGHDGARTGLRWVTHVYRMTSNHAQAAIHEPSEHVAVIELSHVWSFADAYHVGIFEGAARAFGGDVSVQVETRSLSEASLTFRWNAA